MPKLGAEPIRRQALVKATIEEVGHVGSLDVTVSQIAKRAGMSSALAHHYFGGKDQIFIAAMRHILTGFRAEVRSAQSGLRTPRERALAIIQASFADANFQPEIIAAWLTFYVQAQKSDDARRLLRIYQRRLQSNLTHELRPLLGTEAPVVAQGIGAMIDGLYIRQALRAPLDRAAAVSLVCQYLDMHLEKGQTQ